MDLEHEKRLTEVETRSKSNTHRIDKMEKTQDELRQIASAVSALAEREANVETDVKEIKCDVKELTNKPAKKWENFWEKILIAIACAIVGFVLATIGIK